MSGDFHICAIEMVEVRLGAAVGLANIWRFHICAIEMVEVRLGAAVGLANIWRFNFVL